jgi:phosphate transport system substrate-binding protein
MIHPIRRRQTLAVACAVVVVLGACGGGGKPKASPTADTSPNSAAAGSSRGVTLNASGSTFAQPFYEEAIAGFTQSHPDVTVNYGGGGSAKGRQDLADGVVDWAGSDGLIQPADRGKFKDEVLYFPTVAAPITLSYNLPDVNILKLTAAVIARIFQAEITKWDDPAIAAVNPGIGLPSLEIIVAHRFEGSGTTEQFTKFLQTATPEAWKLGSGSTVKWPAGTQAGTGNTGVADIVKSNKGAIGYVDFADAKARDLQLASVQNRAGQYVVPSVGSATAALVNVTVNPDLSYNPLWVDGGDAYPITAPTWILAYKHQADRVKGQALEAFLTYVLTGGQDRAEHADFARVPETIRQRARAQVSQLSASS